ncbi:MAG: PRC-barrel domain containing protein [Rhodospirillales bacterium]|nr:PRC-barrel domain containing protein [Rhodospirillales bacterium]
MIKLLSSASVIALLAMSPAVAQTTTTTPPATTQDKSAAPSATQDKSTTPSVTQEKSTTPSTQSGTQPAAQNAASAITLTEAQAKEWVDKAVYSSDGKELGEVAEFKRSSDNKVTELHADIGGFLGMGETRVKLMPSEFKLQGDRVVLNITEEQAKALPKIEK